jgi:hypothetical protein
MQDTLVNFQNNMNCLSLYADEVQRMLTAYNQERNDIILAMQQMKEHANSLKQK